MKRKVLRLAVGSAATAAFLILFLREVDLGQAWRQIRELPGLTILGALGLVLVNIAFMAVRWRILLDGAGYRVSLRALFSSVCVGRGANNILPARGGDLIRIESMRELARIPAFVTAGTLFAERLLDGVVLAAWIVLGAVLLGQGGALLLTGIALSAGTALGVVLVALAARDPNRAERVVWRATKRLPPRWHTRVARSAANFVEGLGSFTNLRRVLAVFGASVAMWLADVAMYAIVGRAFHLELETGGYFLLEGIGNLALAVPATAAGIGSFDYLTLVAARGIDVPEHTATAYVLTMHALTVLPVTLLGALLVRPGPSAPVSRARRRSCLASSAGAGALELPREEGEYWIVVGRGVGGSERVAEPPPSLPGLEQLRIDVPALGDSALDLHFERSAGRSVPARTAPRGDHLAAGERRRKPQSREHGFLERRLGRVERIPE